MKAVRPLPFSTLFQSLVLVGVIAFLAYAPRAALVGPWIDGDAVRDLFAALDIARHGSRYTYGPHVSGPGFDLGPAYYYLLAFPLWIWDDAAAIAWWALLWRVATVGLLYDTAARLFSRRIAAIAVSFFLLSNACMSVHRPMTHSDLNPLLGLLTVRAVARMSGGRGTAFPLALFWVSLAAHFHALNLLLFPFVLLFLRAGKPDLRVHDVCLAIGAGLIPFLSTVPPDSTSYQILESAVGLPLVGAFLWLAWRPPAVTSRSAIAITALLLAWGVLALGLGIGSVAGHRAFRLFNLAVAFDLSNWDGIASGGSLWPITATSSFLPENLLLMGFAVHGLLRGHVHGATAGEGDFSHSLLILRRWSVATVPACLLVCVLSPMVHYLSPAWAPLCIAAGVSLDGSRIPPRLLAFGTYARRSIAWALAALAPISWVIWWLWSPESRDFRASSRVHGGLALAAMGLPLLVLANLVDLYGESLDKASYVNAGRLIDSLRGLGLDDTAIRTQVHGPVSSRSAVLDVEGGTLFWLQFPASSGPPKHVGRHYVLIPSERAYADWPTLPLHVTGLRAEVVTPALQAASARFLSPPDLASTARTLPYRFPYTTPEKVEPERGNTFLPGAYEELILRMDRLAPSDSHLNAIEVMISNVRGHRALHCQVQASSEGVVVALHERGGREAAWWRYVLPDPRAASEIEVRVAGCQLGYLDVYDVYAIP